jgi:hypothetical protein
LWVFFLQKTKPHGVTPPPLESIQSSSCVTSAPQ